MLNLNSVIVFSENPSVLVDFYNQVFQTKPDWSEGELYSWTVGQSFFTVGPHSEIKGKNKEPARIMYFFETPDVKGEFERMKSFGARVVAEPYAPKESPSQIIATLADPDGNMFQLETPIEHTSSQWK
jgi:predicted enzyme related to lactoylglutathione lyase